MEALDAFHVCVLFQTMRVPWRRVRRIALYSVVLAIVAPWMLILPLAIVQPPTTSVMLARTLQRLILWELPVYPRRIVVPHRFISPNLHRAVLAAEDARFFLHYGLDFIEIENA